MIPAAIIPILGGILDKVIPDPEARQKAKLELMQADMSEDQAFRDFVVAYEGRGDQVNPFLQNLRGSVRPVLTYCLAGAYVWGYLHPGAFPPETMTGLFQLNLISMGFWYGERALKNLGLNLSKDTGL